MIIARMKPLILLVIIATGIMVNASQLRAQVGEEFSETEKQLERLQAEGKYTEGLALAERSMEESRKRLGEDHPHTLEFTSDLATFHWRLGHYDKALELYRRALQGQERVLGATHKDTLATMNNTSAVYWSLGRYAEAERLLKSVIAGMKASGGVEESDTLKVENNLAVFYTEQGKDDEAEPIYLRVLEARQRLLGKDHPDTLTSLNTLGMHYIRRGDLERAAPLLQRALTGRERALGKEHPETITSVSNLGEFYFELGQFKKAGELLARAMDSSTRVAGKEHPATLSIAEKVARLLVGGGRFQEAMELYKQTLEARRRVLGERHLSTVASAHNLAMVYKNLGAYAKAEPLIKKVLEVYQQSLGEMHPESLTALTTLGSLYQEQGRYAEAEALLRRVVEARERSLGPAHPSTMGSINNLGTLYLSQARYTEAEALFKRAAEIAEEKLGHAHPSMITIRNNLAVTYSEQGRSDLAENIYIEVLAASKRKLGEDHPDTIRALANIASLREQQQQDREAAQLFERVAGFYRQRFGNDHPQTLAYTIDVASLYRKIGRIGESEHLLKAVIESGERVLGEHHPFVLRALGNLANIYDEQGRSGEAEPLLKRVLASRRLVLGHDHPNTFATLRDLATCFERQKKFNEAELLFKQGVEGFTRVLGPRHRQTLDTLNSLANLYSGERKFAEAETVLKEILGAVGETANDKTSDDLAPLINLATAYYGQGRYGEAKPLYEKSLARTRQLYGDDHPLSIMAASNLSTVHFSQRNWPKAVELGRQVVAGRMKHSIAQANEIGANSQEFGHAALQRHNEFSLLLKALYHLELEEQERRNKAGQVTTTDFLNETSYSDEMFRLAQMTLTSEAAQAIGQMAARSGTSDAELAKLIRERQDLTVEWRGRDTQRSAALARPAQMRNREADAANNGRLHAIETRIAQIDSALTTHFPSYSSLANPQPLSIGDLQHLLRPDEALFFMVHTASIKPTPGESFLWVITKTDSRFQPLELSQEMIETAVTALRCGLDYTGWYGERCAKVMERQFDVANYGPTNPLPFRMQMAHLLYPVLFGWAEDLIKDKALLIVPSGPLTKLPFEVLLTKKHDSDDYRSAPWLIRKHAITVLPAISSLYALRRTARPSRATRPLIGFGNPLLEGYDSRYAPIASLARKKQSCSTSVAQQAALRSDLRGGIAPLQTRGGLADVSFIRKLTPLPETADELCALARDMRLNDDDLYLGARATERQIKALSRGGELAKYRILHFATHGAMAGELDAASEPGLILTPPDEASEEDDGYLTASEIAGLRLDADWVVLSACNTAAGNAPDAEALSGLSRAFIHAQARTLLVSHWEVDSQATVKLISSAMHQAAADARIGAAEAMRRAIVDIIDHGKPHEAHPAYWAPFVVVGEGAR